MRANSFLLNSDDSLIDQNVENYQVEHSKTKKLLWSVRLLFVIETT